MHNHDLPSEWKIAPRILADISNAVSQNPSITPKELQKGIGIPYRPVEASLPAASLDRMREAVKKMRKEVEKLMCKSEKLTQMQPFVLVLGDPGEENTQCFVYLEGTNLVKSASLRDSFVDVIAAYYCFNISYPGGSSGFFNNMYSV